MRPITLSIALAASDGNGICTTQTTTGADDLTINGALATGGVATLEDEQARQVIITSAGSDESGLTFTVTGTDADGNTIIDAVTGPGASATVTSGLMMQTVTNIAVDGAITGNVTVGTNGVGATKWIKPNLHISPFDVRFGCDVTGTINYTMQHSFDDVDSVPLDSTNVSDVPTAFAHANTAAQTADDNDSYTSPVRAMRVLVNSGTGTVATTWIQAGIV